MMDNKVVNIMGSCYQNPLNLLGINVGSIKDADTWELCDLELYEPALEYRSTNRTVP